MAWYVPWIMWLFPAIFFAYQFILRLWPSLIMGPVMEQFEIGAAGYGLLASAYYFGYAGMQIPVAWACGRWGTRVILAGCAVMCGLGTWAFTFVDSWPVALLARFAVGVGSAAGFLGVSQVISEWFPREQYARVLGMSFTVGLLGAIYGGKPVSAWIDQVGYHQVAGILGLVAVAWGVIVWAGLRSPATGSAAPEPLQFSAFRDLLRRPSMWGLALANLLMVGTLEGFADAWGVPYLVEANQWSRSEAAGIVSFIFMGMMFGGPFLATCSRRWGHYGVVVVCGLGMGLCFWPVLAVHSHQSMVLMAIFFILGILSCYQVMILALGVESVPPALLGVTVGFLNCANMFGGPFFHNMIGQIVEGYTRYTQGGVVFDQPLEVPVYPVEAYRMALWVVPISAVLGCLIMAGLWWAERRKRG